MAGAPLPLPSPFSRSLLPSPFSRSRSAVDRAVHTNQHRLPLLKRPPHRSHFPEEGARVFCPRGFRSSARCDGAAPATLCAAGCFNPFCALQSCRRCLWGTIPAGPDYLDRGKLHLILQKKLTCLIAFSSRRSSVVLICTASSSDLPSFSVYISSSQCHKKSLSVLPVLLFGLSSSYSPCLNTISLLQIVKIVDPTQARPISSPLALSSLSLV